MLYRSIKVLGVLCILLTALLLVNTGAVAQKAPSAEKSAAEAPEARSTRVRSVSDDPALVGQVQVRLKMVGYDPGPIDGQQNIRLLGDGPRNTYGYSTGRH